MNIQEVTKVPIWKIRWQLFLRSFKTNWEIFKENRLAVSGLIIIFFFVILSILHPILIRTVWDPMIYDPVVGFDETPLLEGKTHPQPPSWKHLLGTDPLGRDILSQLMASTPNEFALGVLAALITVSIGTLIGAASAYFGGAVDTFFMRLADLLMLFPMIPFLMFLSAMIEITLVKLALIIGVISGFGGITLVLKAQALTVRVKPFIEAAKASGGSSWYIIIKHIVPNILPLSFLYMMFNVTGAIFSEAVLSFFGLLNIDMSWGIMIHTAEYAGYLIGENIPKYWWLWLPAGSAITLLCAAFYFVGRGLEEIVNPRLRKR